MELPIESDGYRSSRTEPCLLCGEAAVIFDKDGNIIKRESPSQTDTDHGSEEELFSYLCDVLELPNKMDLRRDWDFEEDFFPFCETCEDHLRSVEEIFKKLEELRRRLVEIVKTGEKKYLQDDLYLDLASRYVAFRNAALHESCTPRESIPKNKVIHSTTSAFKTRDDCQDVNENERPGEQKVEQEHTFTEATLIVSSPEQVFLPLSPSDTQEIWSEDEDASVDFSFKEENDPLDETLPEPKATLEEEDEDDVATGSGLTKYQLRSRPSLQLVEEGSSASSSCFDEDYSGGDSSSEVSDDDDFQNPSALDGPPRKTRRRSPTSPPGQIQQKLPLTLWERVASGKANTTSPTTFSGNKTLRGTFSGSMVFDPLRDCVIYRTAHGNWKKTTKSFLTFERIGAPGKCPDHFKCSLCQMRVLFMRGNLKQLKLFRWHWKKFHSTVNRCKFCIEPPFGTSKDLLQHLNSEHGVPNISRMHNIFAIKERKGLLFHKLSLRKEIRDNCDVCGMPFEAYHHQMYVDHMLTHMTEEEQREAKEQVKAQFADASTFHLGRGKFRGPNKSTNPPVPGKETRKPVLNRTKQIEHPGPAQQCQVCGKLVRQLSAHLRTHNEKQQLELCPRCGKALAPSWLKVHMKRFHTDDRKPCMFPGCKEKFVLEEDLKAHILPAHGHSEKAKKGLMCNLCGRGFSVPWCLKQHGLVHTQERNYKCHVCHSAFPIKSTLVNHLSAHHGIGKSEWKCEVDGCPMVYSSRPAIGRHMRIQHGVYATKKTKSS